MLVKLELNCLGFALSHWLGGVGHWLFLQAQEATVLTNLIVKK